MAHITIPDYLESLIWISFIYQSQFQKNMPQHSLYLDDIRHTGTYYSKEMLYWIKAWIETLKEFDFWIYLSYKKLAGHKIN